MALSDSLQHYWKMDDDGTWADSVGSIDLTEQSTVTTRSVAPNGDGADTGGANYLDNTSWDFTPDDMSVAGWMVLDTADADSSLAQGCAPDANFDGRWSITCNSNGDPFVLRWIVRDTSATPNEGLTTGAVWDLGTNYHFAVTRIRNGDLKIYQDGTEIASGTANDIPISDDGNLQILSEIFSVATQWDGGIGQFGIWDRALSGDEVSALYQGGSGNFYDNNNANEFDFEVSAATQANFFAVF